MFHKSEATAFLFIITLFIAALLVAGAVSVNGLIPFISEYLPL